MASIGLALVQGEKNANELAMGRLAAMASMAKSAREADMINEYWDPTRIAERERTLKDADEILEGKERFDKYAKGMAKDPIATSILIMKDKGYGVMDDGQGGYIVYNPETSDQVRYSTKELLADAAVDSVAATGATTAAKIKALADAQRAAIVKAQEKDYENMSYAKHIGNPKNLSSERIAAGNQAATITGHRIDAAGNIMTARTQKELSADKVEGLVDNAAFEATGIYKNKDGSLVGTIKNADGSTGEVAFNSLPIEQQQQYLRSRQNIRRGINDSLSRGTGALQGPALASNYEQVAIEQAEAEKRRQGINLGLPTASNPDRAMAESDRYTKGGGLPRQQDLPWYKQPNLGQYLKKKADSLPDPDYSTGIY